MTGRLIAVFLSLGGLVSSARAVTPGMEYGERALADGLWEIAGLFESFHDARIVAGRVLDRGGTIVAGPNAGRRADDPGAFGTALKQRSIETFSLRLAAFDGAWLQSLDVASMEQMDPGALTAALAERAHGNGRIIATPFLEGETQQEP